MPDKPLPPPKYLSAEGRRIWRELVNAVPVDLFGAVDVPLLVVFVTHTELHTKAAAILAAEGLTTKSTNGTVYPHPCIGILKGAANVMASMGTKLRLCKSSRTPRDAATTQMSRPRTASTKKPWEKAK